MRRFFLFHRTYNYVTISKLMYTSPYRKNALSCSKKIGLCNFVGRDFQIQDLGRLFFKFCLTFSIYSFTNKNSITNDNTLIIDAFIEKLRPTKLQKPILLLNDNARTHLHTKKQRVVEKYDLKNFSHPSYSLDINLCNYDPVCKVKRPMKNFVDARELY